MSKDEIFGFRSLLPSNYANCEDTDILIDAISSSQWRKDSKTTERILRLLRYDTELFFLDDQEDIQPIAQIDSFDKFYELLDYQYVIRQKALTILTLPYRLKRFLIHMPTGTGKTKTATHIICHYFNYCIKKKGLIIWVAHTSELLEQAYNTFCNVWKNIGNGSISTYKLWGKYNFDIPEEMSGFLLCSIQKLQAIAVSNKTGFQRLVNNARLIVYDEAHKAAAAQTREIIEKFMCRMPDMNDCSLMGLTATPGRSTLDSFDNDLLASMFGNRIISIDTRLMNAISMSPQEAANAKVEPDIIKYFQDRGVLAKIKKEELTYPEQLTEAEIKKIKVIATNNGYDDFPRISKPELLNAAME